jgi:type IV secretory pathway VirB2 component (pilin)
MCAGYDSHRVALVWWVLLLRALLQGQGSWLRRVGLVGSIVVLFGVQHDEGARIHGG